MVIKRAGMDAEAIGSSGNLDDADLAISRNARFFRPGKTCAGAGLWPSAGVGLEEKDGNRCITCPWGRFPI